MERRKFILLSTALSSAIALKAFAVLDGVDNTTFLTKNKSLKHIMSNQTMRNIGLEYQRLNPDEKVEQKLLASIGGDVKDNDLVEKELERIIIEDFFQGRTLTIDGWVISETEARQCALLTTLTN